MTNTKLSSNVNWPVLTISGALIVAVAIWAGLAPEAASSVLTEAVAWIASHLGWFYILLATVVLIFVIVVGSSKWGHIRLGPDHSRPQFSLYSWTAMLFAAGIGVDLLFFGVAEPIQQYYNPPDGDPETIKAAHDAIVFTMFHYGITGWAMYALMGMCLGYFAYRKGLPLTVRSALYPLIGRRIYGPAGHAVDISAIIGTVFGVATSLGIGVVQLNYGLTVIFGIPQGRSAQLGLIALAVGVATISAVSGVDKGIKRLSEINVGLALALLAYVLLTGKTSDILNGLVMNVGDYAANFMGLTLNTYAYSNASGWLGAWTLFFWAWWIAWAPFVGMFLARISKGRTLRQFVIGTLTMPFIFILLWVAVFGNSAIQRVLGGDEAFGKLTLEFPERGFYELLSGYPAPLVVMLVASLIGLLLYITSADSAALVTANLSSKISSPDADGPRWTRIFWAVATGALTMAMLLVGGIPALQSATLIIGLPFAFVIILVMFGLVSALRRETHLANSRARTATPAPVERGWSQRLAYAVTYPDAVAASHFIRAVAGPALEDMAEQARELGLEATATVSDDDVPQTDLLIRLEEADFLYRVVPVEYPMPSFALRLSPTEDVYYRLEVFSSTGSLDRDISGFTREQVSSDALSIFEGHLDYLERLDGQGIADKMRDIRKRISTTAARIRAKGSETIRATREQVRSETRNLLEGNPDHHDRGNHQELGDKAKGLRQRVAESAAQLKAEDADAPGEAKDPVPSDRWVAPEGQGLGRPDQPSNLQDQDPSSQPATGSKPTDSPEVDKQ